VAEIHHICKQLLQKTEMVQHQ